jgi:hypothetical protein
VILKKSLAFTNEIPLKFQTGFERTVVWDSKLMTLSTIEGEEEEQQPPQQQQQ